MPSTADPAVEEARAGFVERLGAELGDALVASQVADGHDPWVRIRTDAWAEAGKVAKERLGLEYFCFLSGIDWLPSPFGRGEDDPTQPTPERSTDVVPGVTGGDTRFQVLARLASPRQHAGLLLKVDVPDDTLTIATWVPVFAGANWHERETYEMFGIRFAGHPDLRFLYLPSGFEGHPLRKDFPLLARMVKPWPGIVDVEPMPGSDDDEGGEGE